MNIKMKLVIIGEKRRDAMVRNKRLLKFFTHSKTIEKELLRG